MVWITLSLAAELANLAEEILNMIAIELREARDFTSLYHLSRASKQLAAIGLSHLYRWVIISIS